MKKLIYLVILSLFTSCITSEKIAQKALTDPIAFGKVGEVYRRLNPCVVESTVISSDTTVNIDSLYLPDKGGIIHADGSFKIYDSLSVLNSGLVKPTEEAHNKLSQILDVPAPQIVYITKTIHIKDSIKQKDKTAERIANDSATYYKNLYLQEHGKTLQVQIEKSSIRAKYSTLIWIDVSLAVLLLVIIFLKNKTAIVSTIDNITSKFKK